ncbi:MAG: hypothetical protein ABIZ70_12785 [Gemmatimonadales bacterium]
MVRLPAALAAGFALLSSPVAAQGPGPVGLSPRVRPATVVSRAALQPSVMRRDSDHAATGALIGFLVGVAIVQLPHLGSHRNEDRAALGFRSLEFGVIGGFVGYLIGRGKD